MNDYASQLLAAGPERAGTVIDTLWPELDRAGRSVVVQALAEARRRDRRFGGLHAKWHSQTRAIGDDAVPFIVDELKRKQLSTPVTPYR